MDLTIPLVILACYLVHRIVCWWNRPTWAAEVVREIDADPEDAKDGHTSAVARRVAYEFKAEFGEMRYNKANRCIAAEWVRRRFRDMDMRYVDIVRHMDVCVELCLLPTKHAVAASRIAASREVRERRSAVDHAK